MADYSKSMANFEDYIDEIGWSYEHHAIESIFDESVMQKAKILDVMKNHPNFQEDKMAIVFDADYERSVDYDRIYNFKRWTSNRGWDLCLERSVDPYAISDLISCLFRSESQFISDEFSIDRINSICANNPEYGLTKFKVHSGQKRSRLVGKFCRMFGIDQCEDYDKRFAEYGDALNPLKVKRFTVISVNPADFIMMSNGTSWRSCHNPDKETYSGCNCSGGISHALDSSSIIMYTVHADYEGDLQMAKKVDRCIFFVDENLQHFVQSKVYPDGTKEKSSEFRQIFQMIWTQCTGETNLWKTVALGDYPYSVIERRGGATLYPDFAYGERNYIFHFYPSSADPDSLQKIWAGAKPICVECGSRHTIEDEINCCHYFNGQPCDNCGEYINDDNEEVYSEFHGRYGCHNCMEWCDYLNDWFYRSDDVDYVENIDEWLPVCYLEDSENYVRCDGGCGNWIKLSYSGYVEYEDEFGCIYFYCDDCASEELTECDDCGEIIRTSDAHCVDGRTVCEDCLSKIALKDEDVA